MTNLSWPHWPSFSEEQKQAACAVLESGRINYWTGEQGKAFEAEYAAYVGVPYALACSNGTTALELALRAFEIGEGDEVIVPTRTFIATAGAVVAVGAKPIICDIDPDTNCMRAIDVARVLTPRTRAVIPVHLGGYPAEVDAIKALVSQVGALVIEDCAQANGARYKGRAIGSLGDAGCFSFCQDKIIPLGEGGMVCFSDFEAYKRAWSYRDHGRNYDKAKDAGVGAASPDFKWLNDSFGSNMRLGEMESAIGRIALRDLDESISLRSRNAALIVEGLKDFSELISFLTLNTEQVADGSRHAYYRLYGRINEDALAEGWSRNRIITEINARGIPAQYGSCALIGREDAFEGLDAATYPLEGGRAAHASSIAFFVHPTVTQKHCEWLISEVREVLSEAQARTDQSQTQTVSDEEQASKTQNAPDEGQASC